MMARYARAAASISDAASAHRRQHLCASLGAVELSWHCIMCLISHNDQLRDVISQSYKILTGRKIVNKQKKTKRALAASQNAKASDTLALGTLHHICSTSVWPWQVTTAGSETDRQHIASNYIAMTALLSFSEASMNHQVLKATSSIS
jgi:deoxyxylulose-5-phosphate synthase